MNLPKSDGRDCKGALVSHPTLYPVPGCGKCADLLALHLLTGAGYDQMKAHLVEHEPAPSIWPEVRP